jgi:hypothetical protein
MKQGLKQIKKITAWFGNHLFAVILSVVITSSITISVWRWLWSQHSLQLPGWLWVLIILVISIVPALLVFWITRRRFHKRKRLLANDTDIKNSLRQWFKQHSCNNRWAEPHEWNEFSVSFSDLDRQLGLASGGSMRLLEEVISEFKAWGTRDKGQDTIVIFRRGLTFTCGL